MRNQAWANYVRDKRKARGLTRRKLAELAKIDPSYVTLIERDGYVPRKDKVLEIARAVEADIDQTLLVAGYAPQQIPVKDVIEAIEEIKARKVMDRKLDKDLRSILRDLEEMTASEQRKVAEMLDAYVQTLRAPRRKAAAASRKAARGSKAQA